MISVIKGAVFRKTSINALTWDNALSTISVWATERLSRYICICNVHVLVTSWQDSSLRDAVNSADMATPDGMPIVWVMRRQGHPEQERINGPDLMWKYCRAAEQKGLPVFFYGSTPETLEILSAGMKRSFPNLKIAGTYSPPFRQLTPEEDEVIVETINRSGASVVFVGLGCPKQELWMAEHKGRVQAVMIGVGAAFDFHAGTVKRAPLWMQKTGLEWLYRLASQPTRLWKRYLITNSIFLRYYLLELLGVKKTVNR